MSATYHREESLSPSLPLTKIKKKKKRNYELIILTTLIVLALGTRFPYFQVFCSMRSVVDKGRTHVTGKKSSSLSCKRGTPKP